MKNFKQFLKEEEMPYELSSGQEVPGTFETDPNYRNITVSGYNQYGPTWGQALEQGLTPAYIFGMMVPAGQNTWASFTQSIPKSSLWNYNLVYLNILRTTSRWNAFANDNNWNNLNYLTTHFRSMLGSQWPTNETLENVQRAIAQFYISQIFNQYSNLTYGTQIDIPQVFWNRISQYF